MSNENALGDVSGDISYFGLGEDKVRCCMHCKAAILMMYMTDRRDMGVLPLQGAWILGRREYYRS